VISPIYFSIYIDDLLVSLSQELAVTLLAILLVLYTRTI